MIKRFLLALICMSFLLSASIRVASADEITIRTIITPIGSQCEKWGAAGLMVCIGGGKIEDGGCGDGVKEGWKAADSSAVDPEKIDINYNDIIIFKDTKENHEFDFADTGWWHASTSDLIYEVRGAGGGIWWI